MADQTTAASTEAKTDVKTATEAKHPTDAKPDTKTEATDAPAAGSGSGAESDSSSSDAPKGYSRGENQKLVTDAYRKNWDHIFGQK